MGLWGLWACSSVTEHNCLATYMYVINVSPTEADVRDIVIVNSKFIKRYFESKRRAPAYIYER